MRPLVQEPIHTTSSSTSVIFVPGLRPMYSSARHLDWRLPSSAMSSGFGNGAGDRDHVLRADVPQETMGGRLAASSVTTRSKWAPSSVCSVSQ